MNSSSASTKTSSARRRLDRHPTSLDCAKRRSWRHSRRKSNTSASSSRHPTKSWRPIHEFVETSDEFGKRPFELVETPDANRKSPDAFRNASHEFTQTSHAIASRFSLIPETPEAFQETPEPILMTPESLLGRRDEHAHASKEFVGSSKEFGTTLDELDATAPLASMREAHYLAPTSPRRTPRRSSSPRPKAGAVGRGSNTASPPSVPRRPSWLESSRGATSKSSGRSSTAIRTTPVARPPCLHRRR
jgi:hypothetical protein